MLRYEVMMATIRGVPAIEGKTLRAETNTDKYVYRIGQQVGSDRFTTTQLRKTGTILGNHLVERIGGPDADALCAELAGLRLPI